MNLFAEQQAKIAQIIEELVREGRLPDGLPVERAVVEPPRDAAHGDMASNAAMVLAKPAGMAPRALAETLAVRIAALPDVVAAEVAGPGFINIRLRAAAYEAVVRAALAAGKAFGRSRIGEGRKVNVEYVSANPTGPMHVGHCRGAVYGDALANVLAAAGFDVTREYYVNDAGGQVDVLARSAFLRYREALGEEIGPIPEGLYPGDYLKPVGVELAAAHGASLRDAPESIWLPIAREAAIDAMMAMIRDDLAALDIRHDVMFSERTLHGADGPIAAAIADLRARGLIYEGRLPPPKGQPDADWEDREQTLFRATEFGDDVDRPLMKSNGAYTYFAADIAYHRDKFLRGFSEMIDVWGADHGGYVKRMKAAVAAVTGGEGKLEVEICQLVKLMRDGREVKMSKRSGSFVTLREIVDEVGRDAVRFMMLYRKNDATLEFDLAKVLEQSRDNPVFYVQYAHARLASVFRQARLAFGAEAFGADELLTADLGALTDSGERELMRMVAQYPRILEAAAVQREPHRVAFYLYDLAGALHGHWSRGRETPAIRFVNDESRQLTASRLALAGSLMSVFASGLGLLGVSAPEEMR